MKKRGGVNGITLDAHELRVTEIVGATAGDVPILGTSLVRHELSVTMTPVIKTGAEYPDHYPCGCLRSSYKEPDTFQYFEFEIRKGWLRRFLPDHDLNRILDHHVALEMWTKNKQDPRHPWIHWLFSSTSWLRKGRGRWTGRSYTEGPRLRPADLPEDTLPIVDGGWWKTATPPPERRSL